MIALFLSLALQIGPVIEIPDETADFVTIQAIVRVPALSEKHRNLLRIVGGSLGEETESSQRLDCGYCGTSWWSFACLGFE